MASARFHFKQFSLAHDRCAMKVGTDGVLIGAWASLPEQGCILDIGTGCGLIALMAAQRSPNAYVIGIDINEAAVEQARENVAASPFADRIEIRRQSVQDLAKSGEKFDAIVCNPPFFEESLLPPDSHRSMARHVRTLSFEELNNASATLLQDEAPFSVIIPAGSFEAFRRLSFACGLQLQRSRNVRGTARKEPKRVLATYLKGEAHWTQETDLILNEGSCRTKDYATLTKDFYLW